MWSPVPPLTRRRREARSAADRMHTQRTKLTCFLPARPSQSYSWRWKVSVEYTVELAASDLSSVTQHAPPSSTDEPAPTTQGKQHFGELDMVDEDFGAGSDSASADFWVAQEWAEGDLQEEAVDPMAGDDDLYAFIAKELPQQNLQLL